MNIEPAEILAQLDRIAKSEGFAKAEKLRGFLRLVVENALQPEPEALKEYAIGVRVYGRREDYDPRTDSTVRAEAVRLRTRLGQYYDGAGKDDPIRIEVAKGSYVPQFERRAGATPAVEQPAGRGFGWWGAVGLGLVAVAAGVWWWSRAEGPRTVARGASGIESVAVLHFAALNAGAEMESKAREIRGELMAALAGVRGVRWSGSEAQVSGQGQPEDWAQLGARLKVGAFLGGSVRREPGAMRLTVNLISADGFQLWAETFEQKGSEGGELQRQTIAAAAAGVRRMLGRSARQGRRSPEAVQLYLEALRGQQNGAGLARGEAMARIERRVAKLRECVKLDPQFAEAWSAVATGELQWGEFRQPGWLEHVNRAREAAERALALEEAQEEAHATLGAIDFLYALKLKAAAEHLRRAVELNPRNGNAHQLYGSALAVLGRFGEAIDEMSRAQIGAPDEAGISIGLSNVYFNWRQYPKAEAAARAALEQAAGATATRTKAHWALGIALQAQGRLKEAEAELRRGLALDPRDSRSTVALALLLVQTQREAEAAELWRRGEETWKAWGGLGHTSRAFFAVGRGELAAAVEELWQGYEAREGGFPYFLVDPRLDGVRGERRFGELVSRVVGD